MGVPSISYADDTARAKQLYEEGVTYYEAGRNEEAVVAWTQAYNLSKKPLLLFNIANAHERLGNLMEAIEALDTYRDYATAEEMVQLDARIYNLELRFNELFNPTTPSKTLEVQTISTESKTNWASISLFSAGGVGFALGAGFGLSAASAGSTASDLCSTSPDAYCSAAAQQHLKRESSHALIADIGIGLGVVGMGLGGVMLLSEPGFSDINISPLTLPFGGGASVNGSF